MPGFGSGAFGAAAFGQFNWSRRVLFLTAPEIYRTADADNSGYFRRYAEAQGVSFDNLRLKIANFADLRDPQAVRTRYNETTMLRLGRVETVKGTVEQQGVLATVVAGGVLTTRRGRFTFADVGKELTVTGSSIATNNRSVVVTNIVSPKEILTNPPLSTDVGPLRWELRETESSTEVETRVQVIGGDVDVITPGWILSDGFADFTVLSRTLFKPEAKERKLLTLREGKNGSISTTLRFYSPTLALTSKDVGRRLTISNTAYPEENAGKFEIIDVESATTCLLDSATIVAEPTGELVWALLRDPELVLKGSATLRGAVEQENDDGEIIAVGPPSVFEAVSAAFSSADEGKLLTIHIPGDLFGNNGTYEVLTALSATQIEVDATLSLQAGYRWELRDPTDIGDETQVEVRAPSLLQYLAKDFGIEIDNREEELYQRRWVESVSRWIGMKGHEDCYKYLAELTGFTAEVVGLFRVSQELYEAVTAAGAETYDPGEDGDGRSGDDGSLNNVAGLVQFSSPTAAFLEGDVGRHIDVVGSSGGTNDGLYTINRYVDENTVEFRSVDTMTGAADPNNGSLEWRIVRLYADQAPLLPYHDEILHDLMEYLKTSAVFTVDKYCWEQSPSPWSTLLGPGDAGDGRIFITSVNPPGPAAFPTIYTVEGRGDFEVAVGLGEGRWRLTDSDPAAYFLETLPTLHERNSGTTGFLRHSPPFFIRRFFDNGATFTSADVGRVLVIENSVYPENNKAYLIAALISAHSLQMSASSPVRSDSSPTLRWRILDPDATGVDGSLTAPRRFTSPSGPFAATDEGKRLIVSESGSGNNRQFVIETYIDANNVDLAPYDTPATPDANNGALVWAMFSYEFTVQATEPPNVGAASLEYICPEQMTCNYCRSNKVLVEASTPYLLEKGLDRLRDRLEQGRPKHVELVENFGFEVNASLNLTATVDSP
jgi:hypothetical protein